MKDDTMVVFISPSCTRFVNGGNEYGILRAYLEVIKWRLTELPENSKLKKVRLPLIEEIKRVEAFLIKYDEL